MDVTETKATEATAESIHEAFQAMHNDLTKREAELIAELELRTKARKKRALEHKDQDEEEGATRKKQHRLTVETWYSLSTLPSGGLSKVCALEEHTRVVSVPSPQSICIRHTTHSSLSLCWDPFSGETEGVQVVYQAAVRQKGKQRDKQVREVTDSACVFCGLAPDTEYEARVRAGCCGTWGPWSETAKAHTTCVVVATRYPGHGWKECPAEVSPVRAYTVSGRRTATYNADGGSYCTILGDTALETKGTWTWGVKVLKSKNGNGGAIWVGVAPADTDQNNKENYAHGWYFWCFDSSLWSGLPQNYSNYTAYGNGDSVAEGQTVQVELDMDAKTISFAVDGVDLGVAYDSIPLEKPLVPAVILGFGGDSVELVQQQVRSEFND